MNKLIVVWLFALIHTILAASSASDIGNLDRRAYHGRPANPAKRALTQVFDELGKRQSTEETCPSSYSEL